MTEHDRALVELLRADARAPVASLARSLGMTPAAVKRRIEALRRSGAITGFTVTLGAGDVGAEAVVELFCRGKTSADELRELVATIPGVALAVSVAGVADAVLVMQAPTMGELAAAIEDIRASPRVDRTRSSVVFERLA